MYLLSLHPGCIMTSLLSTVPSELICGIEDSELVCRTGIVKDSELVCVTGIVEDSELVCGPDRSGGVDIDGRSISIL